MILAQKTNQLPFNQVHINDDFWNPRLKMMREEAIFYQWDQLEKTRCIDNFRILSGEKQGFREGWFFSDSDAYKWLDAASRIYSTSPSDELKRIMDTFIEIIRKCQNNDGYIYTFNQIHFPDQRWTNLWIEHELYCFGHLIEAILSYYEFCQESEILEIAKRSADLLVHQFLIINTNTRAIPGHQEIELALIKLYRKTKRKQYLKLAKEFIQRRGKSRFKWLTLLKQDISNSRRVGSIKKLKSYYLRDHPEDKEFQLPENVYTAFPSGFKRCVLLNYASGKYFQTHLPLEKQITPEGHAVRFSYLMTAAAMYSYETDKKTLLSTLETVWDHMVQKRMFVTGGIGSIPGIEGFGRDYELDPEYAYCETCAALGSIFWNFEMLLLSPQAKYADLLEWQLYNAASVGMALDGRSYLYRNPLVSQGNLTRKEWFEIPCCPSNLTRTWASIGQYIYSYSKNAIWIHQYIGNKTQIPLETPKSSINIILDSAFPWQGKVQIKLSLKSSRLFSLFLRFPSWSDTFSIKINNEEQEITPQIRTDQITASGYSPYKSQYLQLIREWKSGDVIDLLFPMEIKILKSHPKVKTIFGNEAISRGPIVYCLESIDNPKLKIFDTNIENSSLYTEYQDDLLNGVIAIKGKNREGLDVLLIPYYCWANRGKSEMNVMMNID